MIASATPNKIETTQSKETLGSEDKDKNAAAAKKFKAIYEQSLPLEKEEQEEENEMATASPPVTLLTLVTSTAPPLSPTMTAAPAVQEVKALFVQLVGTMTTLNQKGLTTTTLILNPGKGSILSGTEISILEYNTAPKDFNIQIKGTPEAVQLLDKHLGELVAAFNVDHRPFKINRVDLFHTTRRSGVRRAESKAQIEESIDDDSDALPLG